MTEQEAGMIDDVAKMIDRANAVTLTLLDLDLTRIKTNRDPISRDVWHSLATPFFRFQFECGDFRTELSKRP